MEPAESENPLALGRNVPGRSRLGDVEVTLPEPISPIQERIHEAGKHSFPGIIGDSRPDPIHASPILFDGKWCYRRYWWIVFSSPVGASSRSKFKR